MSLSIILTIGIGLIIFLLTLFITFKCCQNGGFSLTWVFLFILSIGSIFLESKLRYRGLFFKINISMILRSAISAAISAAIYNYLYKHAKKDTFGSFLIEVLLLMLTISLVVIIIYFFVISKR